MSGIRQEVLWSPVCYDEFITWGTEIYLYRTIPRQQATQQYVELSHSTCAQLISTNSSYHLLKCLDIKPKASSKEEENLLAVGLANGRVALINLMSSPLLTSDSKALPLEFVPKHSRMCHSVLWNPYQEGLVAAGMEKHRNDCGVIIWNTESPEYPLWEVGASDSSNSIAWLHSSPTTLAASFNNKSIRVYDLRDNSKIVNGCQTKAVYGVSACPDNAHQLASYVDYQIAVWDMRKFDKPLVTAQKNKLVSKIAWCPTRRNLVGCLLKESSSIYMIDMLQTHGDDDNEEATVIERSVKPWETSHHYITSFSWHPKHHNRLLALSVFGGLVDYSVNERMTLSWGHSSTITWTSDSRTINIIDNKDSKVYKDLGDVSSVIRSRVLDKYGLQSSLRANSELIDNNEIRKVWNWLETSQTLVENGIIDFTSANGYHPGVRTVLGLKSTSSSVCEEEHIDSVVEFQPWSSSHNSSPKLYRSGRRDRALHLCGWSFTKDPTCLAQTVETLIKNGEVTKAAAYCVFVQNLKKAIQILSLDDTHSTVAMALSGFSHDKNTMWKESCSNLRCNISDPFLRIIFSFLTSDFETYHSVLMEVEVDVMDRVGFALTFLSDSYLNDYIEQLTEYLVLKGDLDAIFLTGMTEEVIGVLQQYVNLTSDIQTVSLLCLRALPSHLLQHDLVQYWIHCYRELLDSWMLWEYRAEFDIWLSARSQIKPSHQVYVVCNFCSKCAGLGNSGAQGALGPASSARSKATSLYPRYSASSNQTKISCCPHCRKPQPRCSICLINMGTGSVHVQQSVLDIQSQQSSNNVVNPFDSWYTWCQTCRHGGHSNHITSWFREHTECPVTGCICKCMSLDSVGSVSSVLS